MTNLKPLEDIEELHAAIVESRERPVLLFKHSRNCGVSLEALDELRAYIGVGPRKAAFKLITVQSHRDVSDAAATRLGLRHETPQAILLRNERVVWNASHFRITAHELSRILES